MGNGSDEFQGLPAGKPPVIGDWLRHLIETLDGDIAFRLVVTTAGLLSTAAFTFGLMWF